MKWQRPALLWTAVLAAGLGLAWLASSLGFGEGMAQFMTFALAALAMITAVVPGTVWSELASDRSVLLMHVFDVEDEAAFIAHFKQAYERPLQEIFE